MVSRAKDFVRLESQSIGITFNMTKILLTRFIQKDSIFIEGYVYKPLFG